MRIRPATIDDLPALLALEESGFAHDRFSRRSLRHLLTRAHATTFVAEADPPARGGDPPTILGYAMVLFHRGTALARLYSIAVDPEHRGCGIGDALLERAEAVALDEGCVVLRLEVHTENPAARRLYARHGYREFGRHPDYYEDHGDAIRMEKRLVPEAPPVVPVPYYRQTLEFTCGAAALLMALRAHDPAVEPTRVSELRLWREATSIFMTSGHGGCGPHGLALAAARRGFDAAVYVGSDEDALFVDSVRSPDKKEVIRLVEEDFREQLGERGIGVHEAPLSAEDLRTEIARGRIPVVLISLYRLTRERAPHWVTVTGVDDRFVYVHDPWVDPEEERTLGESANIPIARGEFEGMARYGRRAQRAAVLIGPPSHPRRER